MNEDTYYADSGVEYDGAEQREELDLKFRPYVPDYGPPAAPEKPKAHINEWCEGCHRPRLRLLEPRRGLFETKSPQNKSDEGEHEIWRRCC